MKVREITQLAMLIALTILLGVVPNIGLIQIGPVALTIMHIPVIVAAFMFGIKGGAIVGLTFGLASWYAASTRAVTPIDLLFVNPLVSVLPRLLFGIATGFLIKAFKSWKDGAIKYGTISFISTFIHSALVFTLMYVCGQELFFPNTGLAGAVANYIPFIISAFTINALVEAVVAALICAILMQSLNRLYKN